MKGFCDQLLSIIKVQLPSSIKLISTYFLIICIVIFHLSTITNMETTTSPLLEMSANATEQLISTSSSPSSSTSLTFSSTSSSSSSLSSSASFSSSSSLSMSPLSVSIRPNNFIESKPVKASTTSIKVTRDLCPLMDANGTSMGCSCYQFTDGLYVECPSTNLDSIRTTLQLLSSPVKSLTVYNLDPNITYLPFNVFTNSTIESIHISFTRLTNLSDSAFNGLSGCLRSLSLVNSKLTLLPQSSLSGLRSLTSLDLEANEISEIESYTTYGLPLESLNLHGNRISSLLEYSFGGLEATLEKLILSSNRLDGFPLTALRRLRKLRELKLSGNRITDIPDDGFTRLTALTSLDLSSNSLVTLSEKSFITMPKLVTLSLYNNRLTFLEERTFFTLLDLESLDLSHNSLRTLPSELFTGLTSLKTLDLSHNHLHSIEFGTFHNLPSLRELYLNRNNLLHLINDTFWNTTSLSVLWLTHNALQDIEFGTLYTLRTLNQLHLSFNSLRSIHPNLFKYNHELRSLSLDNNLIANIQPGTFQELVELRDLRLQRNLLKKVRKGVFYSFPNLQELHLQNNRIEVIENEALASLASLELLNIQGNKLIEMSDFLSKFPSSLKYLQLNNNTIFTVHNDSLMGQTGLQILWLNGNKIEKLTATIFSSCSAIEKLYLENNEISTIESGTFTSLRQLIYLNLQNNNLNHLSSGVFTGATSLTELILSGNHLMDIEPNSLSPLAPTLSILDLSNNQLYVIREHFFTNLTQLNFLSLSNVMVEELDPNTFTNLTSLTHLDLSENNLSSEKLESLVLPPSLTSLNLSTNNASLVQRPDSFLTLEYLESLDLSFTGYRGRSAEGATGVYHIVPIHLASSLKTLYLQGNSLTHLDGNSFGPPSTSYPQLISLALDYNHLETFTSSELGSEQLFPSLNSLSISSNRLRHLGSSSFRTLSSHLVSLNLANNSLSVLDPGSLANLSHLKSLDLSNNVMRYLAESVFTNLTLLENLNLSSNWFQYIPNNLIRSNLSALKSLNLNGNPMLRIREDLSVLGSFPSLTTLTINSGNLSIIASHDFFGFPTLTTLSLVSNHISKISPGSFRPLTSLTHLNLAHNELEILPEERLSGLIHLELLNCTHNHLVEMPYFGPSSSSSNLKLIDLSHNRITRLDTLGHLGSSLKTLYLAGNSISWIANNALQNLTSLVILDLRFNFLTHLSVVPLETVEITIDSLLLAGNPLHCDCRLLSLWEWLQSHSRLLGSVDHDKELTCAGPDKLFGSMVLSLHPVDFCPIPTISLLEAYKLEASTITVHWEVANESLVSGFTLDYHATSERMPFPSTSKELSPLQRYMTLEHLSSETWYTVCLHASEKYLKTAGKPRAYVVGKQRNFVEYSTSNRKCIQVRTLSDHEKSHRLLSLSTVGVIVGVSVCTVFIIILVILLTSINSKRKRRRPAKDEVPEEYITYRHFSLPTSENVYS